MLHSFTKPIQHTGAGSVAISEQNRRLIWECALTSRPHYSELISKFYVQIFLLRNLHHRSQVRAQNPYKSQIQSYNGNGQWNLDSIFFETIFNKQIIGVGCQGTKLYHLSSSRQFHFLLVLTPIRTLFTSRGDDLSKKVLTLGSTSWLSDYIRPRLTFCVIVDLNHTLTPIRGPRSPSITFQHKQTAVVVRVKLLKTTKVSVELGLFSNRILNDIDPRLWICYNPLFPGRHQILTGFTPRCSWFTGLISHPRLTSNEILQSSRERFRELGMISLVFVQTPGIRQRHSIRPPTESKSAQTLITVFWGHPPCRSAPG